MNAEVYSKSNFYCFLEIIFLREPFISAFKIAKLDFIVSQKPFVLMEKNS